ncbi:hypothetical protein Tco_1080115 [Tanacetum coccineum]|uniref:Tf2-1-like SH3-like domain-containing protein n=1 Tax=Tanacetum coccineum TaxID=301880 RepID=A0ABQ5HTS5_9ASTR
MTYLVVLADAVESVRDAIRCSYYLSIWCAPFEALYGKKCRSLVLWAVIRESSLTGLELVQETIDKVVLVKEKPKMERYRQKSYVDYRRNPLEFEVGDHVLLKVMPWKGVVHFGKKGKLALRYVGPFEILERIGLVAYRLRLPEELNSIHDTFCDNRDLSRFVLVFVEAAKQSVSMTVSLLWIVSSERDRLIVVDC